MSTSPFNLRLCWLFFAFLIFGKISAFARLWATILSFATCVSCVSIFIVTPLTPCCFVIGCLLLGLGDCFVALDDSSFAASSDLRVGGRCRGCPINRCFVQDAFLIHGQRMLSDTGYATWSICAWYQLIECQFSIFFELCVPWRKTRMFPKTCFWTEKLASKQLTHGWHVRYPNKRRHVMTDRRWYARRIPGNENFLILWCV